MMQVKGTDVSEFYFEHGYFHFRPSSSHFLRDIEEAAQTFHDLLKELPRGELRTAFKNKDGLSRHLPFVHLHKDIFLRLMLSEEVRTLVRAVFGSKRIHVLHSKISYKEAGQDLAWYPHQDNGYRLVNRAPLRKGMAVGIFLEDADDRNGTLELFPGSHKLKIDLYEGFSSDENGDPPVIINGDLSFSESLLCRLHGIPKKIRLAAGSVPVFKRWYRRLKYG